VTGVPVSVDERGTAGGSSYHRGVHRFLCDAMLGSLARWLRFFGYDAAFLGPDKDDSEVAEQARVEQRWLLTRDRELAATGPRTLLIREEDVEPQLVEVFSRLGLRPDADLGGSRCSECNGELEVVDRSTLSDDVPPYVLATADRFRRCAGCGRIYWPGTHTDRIVKTMESIVERLERT
jgi:uncharacterized protein with PIN domain